YGDGAFYVSHFNGQVFYFDLHPGDVEVLDWRPDGQPARVMVQFDDRIETWTDSYVQIETNSQPGTPAPALSGSPAPMHPSSTAPAAQFYANPYGMLPVILFRNWPRPGSRWGDSTLEHIKAACRLLNERIDLLMWLVRVQGNPPIKALGVETATLRTDPGEIWSAPADATIELVKLLDAETAGIHINTVNLLLQVVKELSNTPSIAYGTGSANLSGRALELAYMPLTQAAAIRRGFLSEAIRQRNRVILTMAQVLHGTRISDVETSVLFAPVVPADLFAARDQDRQDLQLGILPKEVYTQRYVN
ncbi:MAG TPA: phage portal protein, partial [Anaerolineae bacterium]